MDGPESLMRLGLGSLVTTLVLTTGNRPIPLVSAMALGLLVGMLGLTLSMLVPIGLSLGRGMLWLLATALVLRVVDSAWISIPWNTTVIASMVYAVVQTILPKTSSKIVNR